MNDASVDWNAIHAFAVVARTGSLTEAAKRLGLSQPTLGRRLDALEARLGATLFVRGRAGTVPTEAGLALIEAAEGMARQADALLRRASGRRAALEGDVRVTASRVVAHALLPEAVLRLAETAPQIRLDVVASDAVADLLARDADVALRMVRPTQPDVIATKLGALRLGAFAAPSYLAAGDRPARIGTLDDLRAHRVVGYDRSPLILDAMRAMGWAADRSVFALRTDDQVLYQRLVTEGAGLGFLPELIAGKAGLVAVPLAAEPPALPIWLAAHRDLRTNAAVRHVGDVLRAVVRQALA